jgi:hypothetical protein
MPKASILSCALDFFKIVVFSNLFCSCRFLRCSLLVEKFMYINVHKFEGISVKVLL